MTQMLKFALILRVRLDPQTGSQYELANSSTETRQESIEREISGNDTVQEL